MKSHYLINGNESKAKLADILWAKNRGAWWPAQVVDENLISGNCKPSKRSAGKVLVRLFGTYAYSYVDPIKWRSEFDKVLEQNNGSYSEVLSKSLEQEISSLRTSESKRKRSKGTEGNESRQQKDSDQKIKKPNGRNNSPSATKDTEKKNCKRNSSIPETCLESGELSARRLKVMRCLGLAAPPGSPFGKNGQIM